jgi:hypothetical protein
MVVDELTNCSFLCNDQSLPSPPTKPMNFSALEAVIPIQ